MEPFHTHTGIAAPLERENVDTDAIIPKQFLKRIEKSGYGQYLFYDWRFKDENQENESFILNQPAYRNATILLAGKNFGCGSSREHAPWALEDYGFRVIIAPSFADIFFNNCFKNGILPIVISEKNVSVLMKNAKEISDYKLTIDLEKQELFDDGNNHIRFDVDEYRKNMLLNGLDEIGSTLQEEDKISSFEAKHHIFYHLNKGCNE